ncbi:MAG: glycerophosphoryl diester phosphodiesterase [Solirubrobacteraceae bacterium]|nr:glycerophosphoryl diester phosphodiesterase [Solirubrobacteraceae bacterium]
MTKRVGHRGAHAVVKGNTLGSFEAALELGVDMIEFDVCAVRGRLGIAHNPLEGRLLGCLALETGLAHLAAPRFGGIELNVDIKHAGCERGALESLQRHDLLERSLISSQLPGVLDRVRAFEPDARTGLSVGGPLTRWLTGLRDWRRQVADALAAGRFQAIMAHHQLVDPELVERVKDAGAELYAWTVDDGTLIDRLTGLEVTGITTNDPRLFAARAAAP